MEESSCRGGGGAAFGMSGGGRWVSMLGSMALELCGGSIYITGIYSTDLKHRFFPGADSQLKIEQLVFACNLGNWLPAAGFFNDSRFGGGRNTAWVAAALTLLGYLGVFAWSAGLADFAYWQVWVFWFLWGHGSGWFDNAAVSTTAQNFPQQRGRSLALVKTFYGLSGSILTQAYSLFFYNKTSEFLIFLGVALSVLGALNAPLLRIVTRLHHGERDQPIQRLGRGLGVVLGMACLLLAGSVAKVIWGSSVALNVVIAVGVLLCLGLVAWQLVAGASASEASSPLAAVATPVSRAAHSAGAPDLSPREALRTPGFWLLFLVTFVGMGSGLVVLNHAGQMILALGGNQSETSVLVSLISIANCFGRVTFGVVPDSFVGVLSRPWFLALNTVVMACGQLLLSAGSMPLLFSGAMISAFAYGGFWTLMPSLVIELCGLAAFATLYNFMSLATSSASLVFSTVLASKLYDHEAALHPHPSASGSCFGPTCYRSTCLTMVVTLAAGFLSAAALACRMRRTGGSSSAEREIALDATC